jgi:hypothetical protein
MNRRTLAGMDKTPNPNHPRAFLCHAFEDKEIARLLAEQLQSAGIETFFDEWSIRAGDSLRTRIEEGLANCTHFLVLLSPKSINRPWVNAEIDAAFVRKVQGRARLIPLRLGLEIGSVPPLLAALHCPAISTDPESIQRLVGDIYDVSRTPPLGSPPPFAFPVAPRSGLSVAAQQIARYLITHSEHGRPRDPKATVEELRRDTSLPDEDLLVAVDELERHSLVHPVRAIGCGPLGYYAVEPEAALFLAFDSTFMGWSPQSDALTVLAELINSGDSWLAIEDAAARLGWAARRMNPALSYLIRNDVILPSRSISHPFLTRQFSTSSSSLAFLRRHKG